MKTKVLSLLVMASGILFTSLPSPGQEVFDFYGLRFGMSQEEVKGLFPGLGGNLIDDPGHGMTALEVYFDRENLLMEIRASYGKGGSDLENKGLERALREKFVMEARESFPDIAVSVDEYGNRAAYKVNFLSTGIRERNIEYYKEKFLRGMD